jgi:hypothetical protein
LGRADGVADPNVATDDNIRQDPAPTADEVLQTRSQIVHALAGVAVADDLEHGLAYREAVAWRNGIKGRSAKGDVLANVARPEIQVGEMTLAHKEDLALRPAERSIALQTLARHCPNLLNSLHGKTTAALEE